MSKIEYGDGQYIVYTEREQDARNIVMQELTRVNEIKEKIADLLLEGGKAKENFMTNTSEERLNIHFNDETSYIFDDPENATTKGEVKQRLQNEKGDFYYSLAYRYQNIDGHNANFRLAHEMGHLVLNPSEVSMQTYDKETNSRQVAGFIRRDEQTGQFYGQQIQENAINLIAQLAIRDRKSADDIISGKVDLTEYNLYKRCDDLVKLLANSMRNDFNKEISFDELIDKKIDSMIELPDGTKEPANTFFYGMMNDTSIVENEFDKYMGKGSWQMVNEAFSQMYQPNISKDRFDRIFEQTQGMIVDYTRIRFQEKYNEAKVRSNGQMIPSLESKNQITSQLTGIVQENHLTFNNDVQQREQYTINEFGEIIRPNRRTSTTIQ